MSIKIKSECYFPALEKRTIETRWQYYHDHSSLKRREERSYESQSDTSDYREYRDSDDNGRTWGEWIRESAEAKQPLLGEDQYEYMDYPVASHKWNPVHQHYVTISRLFVYVNGYDEARANYWKNELGYYHHSYVVIEDEAFNQLSSNLIAYEDGALFDKETYRTSGYLQHNCGSCSFMTVLKNGDILFNLEIYMRDACRLAGVDVNAVFPSCPNQGMGILICRGVWNAETQRYDISFSDPIMLDDRISSRGLAEAAIAELESGRILVVFRADNIPYNQWNSRTTPNAPGYKWYCLSDDGGKTFSPLMPWHFDTREVIYSSGTYSAFIRSTKNGKLYWVGNVTDPTMTKGNSPRYPLQIVEVDDEWGFAKKDTFTVIDTRREGETEEVQLSNFCLLEDRETGDIELYLSKYCQYEKRAPYYGEGWKYTITVPPRE